MKAKIKKIPLMIDNVLDLQIEGLISTAKAKEKIEKLKSEKLEVEEELKKIENNIHDIDKPRHGLTTIWQQFKNEKDICRKRELLKSVVDRIYIYKDGKIEIVFIEK